MDVGTRLTLMITNFGERAEAVRFYASGDQDRANACTYLVDDRGVRYSGVPGGVIRRGSSGAVNVLPKVPVSVELLFEPVSDAANSATLVPDGVVYLGAAVVRTIPLR